jgi:AGCS family alanine or glycine:cation symporter
LYNDSACYYYFGVWDSGVSGATLTSNAFNVAFVGWGSYIVSISISIFAFTTLIGWSYYGDRSVEYLFGEKYVKFYKILFITAIPIGAIIELKIVWTFSDVANALMALPNLIAVIMLSGIVAKMTKEYFSNKDNFKV